MQVSLENIFKNAGIFIRLFSVYAVLGLFASMDVVSYGSQAIQETKPLLTCLAIFYWSVYRPTLVPFWLVFLLGLVIDLFSGYPLGLTALGFLLLRGIITSQRRLFLGQPFVTILLGFSIAIALFYAMQWSLIGLLHGQTYALWLAGIKVAAAIAVFPVFVLGMRVLHRTLPSEASETVKRTGGPILRR